jgi:ABC-type transport system substrate-binding protein
VLAVGIVPATPRKPGASAIAVNLRPGVVWHDEKTPFTADDVIFTYEYIRKASANKQQREFYSKLLLDVRRGASPQQVVFEFNRPVLDPREVLLDFIIPAARFSRANPETVPEPKSAQEDLDVNPMGTGPYRFQKMAYGYPTLSVFPHYHGTPGNLETVGGHEYVDQSLMVESFVNAGGSANLVVEVPPKLLPRVESSNVADFGHVPSYNVFAIALRQKPGSPLNNERVRRALTMAINRDKILETWFGGQGEVVGSPVVGKSLYWDPSVKPLPYDTIVAKRELQALVPAGTRLTFVYPTGEFGSDTHISDMVETIRQALESVGLKIDLQGKKMQFYDQALFGDRADFDLALVRWEFNPAYSIRPLFHRSNIQPGGFNYMNFDDPLVSRRLDDYDSATEEARRQNLMSLLQKDLNQKAPAIFLLSEEKVFAYHKRYSIPPGTVDPFYFFTYVGQWWLDR